MTQRILTIDSYWNLMFDSNIEVRISTDGVVVSNEAFERIAQTPEISAALDVLCDLVAQELAKEAYR